jgi:hypothetical protein
MPKPDERASYPTIQVRGSVDVEKFKAARTLGGDEARFELRAMKPAAAGSRAAPISCIVCIICIVCVVCAAETAERFGIQDLPALPQG